MKRYKVIYHFFMGSVWLLCTQATINLTRIFNRWSSWHNERIEELLDE